MTSMCCFAFFFFLLLDDVGCDFLFFFFLLEDVGSGVEPLAMLDAPGEMAAPSAASSECSRRLAALPFSFFFFVPFPFFFLFFEDDREGSSPYDVDCEGSSPCESWEDWVFDAWDESFEGCELLYDDGCEASYGGSSPCDEACDGS